MHVWAKLICMVFAGLLLSDGVHAAAQVRLESVSVHLFLEKSGTFSVDVTTISNFYSWNFEPSGDGIPEGERFAAILIKVRMRSDKEVFAKGEQARLSIRSLTDSKIIKTYRITDVYVGPDRVAHQGFFIPGISCKPLEIVVTAGSKRIKKALKFNCGE